MSSIATRTKTDSGAPSAVAAGVAGAHRAQMRKVALAAAMIIMCILMISFRPFMPEPETDGGGGGDIINQLGFSLLGVMAMLALATLADPRKVARIVGFGWSLMFLLLFASLMQSIYPAVVMRGAIFTMIGVCCVVAVLALPQDGDGYARLLMTVASVVLVISYAGVVLLPAGATHGADPIEPQNSYLWRGVFSHKNVAGPVMAAFAFSGLYLWRRGWRVSGVLIGLSALFFVAQTGSKTTMALVPMAMLLVMVPGAFGLRFLTVAAIFSIQFLFAFLTFGTVLCDPVRQFVESLGIDATFTGRVSIWQFAIENLPGRLWTGYGYESFWKSPIALEAANPYYLGWDVRNMVHAHNGYLDLVIAMGIPGLICGVAVIIVMPLVNYMRCRPQRENLLLADYFLMIVFFCTLNAMMESFFFRRVDPVWLTTLLGIFGLRLTSRISIPKRLAASTGDHS